MSYHCPTCGRLLYDRRLTNCGFCGSQIPERLRFTSEEVGAIDKKMADLDEERAQRQRAADEEVKRKEKGDAGGFLSGI
jgi:hypothetical protein